MLTSYPPNDQAWPAIVGVAPAADGTPDRRVLPGHLDAGTSRSSPAGAVALALARSARRSNARPLPGIDVMRTTLVSASRWCRPAYPTAWATALRVNIPTTRAIHAAATGFGRVRLQKNRRGRTNPRRTPIHPVTR
ncbi:MAG: hypothetical protein WCF04_00310 [Candidatus Nanopelagicales bacterium]